VRSSGKYRGLSTLADEFRANMTIRYLESVTLAGM
jgi:hypothetical protein